MGCGSSIPRMPPMCEDEREVDQFFNIEIKTLVTSKNLIREGKLLLRGMTGIETVGDILMLILQQDSTAPSPDQMKLNYNHKGKVYDLTHDVRRSLKSCGINNNVVLQCEFLSAKQARRSNQSGIPIHSTPPTKPFSLTIESLTGNKVLLDNVTGQETIIDIQRRYEEKTSVPAWNVDLSFEDCSLTSEYWRSLLSFGLIKDTTLIMSLAFEDH
mmetsp:Transcript_12975/g.18038  ORF Transcript_12975/g.18038 Transcript_12975/m.18038 type:complete len:214 (+) Transcript_12975:20-661(+)